MRLTALLLVSLVFVASCKDSQPEIKPLTTEERIQRRVDSIRLLAQDGDLITRLNDNIISHQIRFLNKNDKSYSHGGIVQTIGNVKMVCHIDAGEAGADTIHFEPIDSFINPNNNLSCGLFRYAISEEEKKIFLSEINNYQAKKVHFDRLYGLMTDSLLYCSEMIYKALKKATNDRIVIESSFIPKPMLKAVHNYLDRKYPIDAIAANKIVTIDNLYLLPDCKEIVRFQLKEFPGQ